MLACYTLFRNTGVGSGLEIWERINCRLNKNSNILNSLAPVGVVQSIRTRWIMPQCNECGNQGFQGAQAATRNWFSTSCLLAPQGQTSHVGTYAVGVATAAEKQHFRLVLVIITACLITPLEEQGQVHTIYKYLVAHLNPLQFAGWTKSIPNSTSQISASNTLRRSHSKTTAP